MKAVAQGLYKLKADACKEEKKGGFIGNFGNRFRKQINIAMTKLLQRQFASEWLQLHPGFKMSSGIRLWSFATA